ncbi:MULTISPECIES: 50S ribosomal protein L24 [Kangiella]|jgi:large subunit ribosomal protein L24|uniref:Large ribosomal subunit protein uL24 n=2 Tax=Kangiella TaxID=261963 RepID=A0A318D9D6_9GAMM|nr:50S ribosomal protein L24 [Rickettsiales bacterium]PXF63497.1 50S ribosomal protein L24 [Kangiella spongicola]
MQKIKSGDEVIVIAGKDKGKRGNVDRVLPNGRVIVSGVNIIKKHTKPSQNPDGSINEGGIIEKEAALDASNVAIYNPSTGKADRVGIKVEDGKKTRFFKKTGEAI